MMVAKQEYLITLNSRGKAQMVDISLLQEVSKFEIHRFTGQFEGKQIVHPVITITEGKAKRTILQQAELEYNSHIKKYLDKGYKKLTEFTTKSLTTLKSEDLLEFLGEHKTDTNGIPKPMLAVQSEKCSAAVFDKTWFISRKLDGVRSMMYLKDGIICTASRGGKDYDAPTSHIRNSKVLQQWFEKNPDMILDGELYCHGIPLQRISGCARLKEWEDRCNILEYWIYDIVSDKPFIERFEILMDLQELMQGEEKIQVIDHYSLAGWSVIKKRHDQFVEEGYEGLVMRAPNKEYGIGKRSSLYLIKLKNYLDGEYKIVGYKDKLRPEDMVFTLEDKNGKTFEAKPHGPRELKYEYLDNMESIIGKMATVKYFYESEEGTPLQATLKTIRDYE